MSRMRHAQQFVCFLLIWLSAAVQTAQIKDIQIASEAMHQTLPATIILPDAHASDGTNLAYHLETTTDLTLSWTNAGYEVVGSSAVVAGFLQAREIYLFAKQRRNEE